MIAIAKRCQPPVTSWAARRSRTRRGITRKRFTPRPITARKAGRKVADAMIETIGTSTPPTPIERMNGSGMNTSSPRPMATVSPENSVARPGRAHRLDQRGVRVVVALELLAIPEDDEHRVVDRDREADQRDDVRHVDRHVHVVREDPHEAERHRDA